MQEYYEIELGGGMDRSPYPHATTEQHIRRQGKSKEELVQLPLVTDFDALWFAKELFIENRALSE